MAIGTAAAILGGAAISALAGSSAAKSAAGTQAKAATEAAQIQTAQADRAAQLQKEMFDRQVALQEPWRAAGINALGQLQGQAGAMPAAFTGQVNMLSDPGYQFRLSEGLKGLERSAAARGGLMSGAAGKALTRFGQDYASNEYQNAYNRALTEYNARVNREATGYNRLASLAGIGQTATGALGAAGSQYGTNVGNLYTQAGQAAAGGLTDAAAARASGYVGATNALTGGIGQAINYYTQNQMMNRLFPSYMGSSGGGFSAAPGTNTMSNAFSTWAPNPFGG